MARVVLEVPAQRSQPDGTTRPRLAGTDPIAGGGWWGPRSASVGAKGGSGMSRISKHLSYANVVATLCLFLLLGAGAHAAGLAKNSVKSKHIKNAQVKTADLAGNAVDGSKVADNSLTGAEVNESTLAGVNAQTAVTAQSASTVGGMSVKKINFQVQTGTGKTAVLDFPGKFRLYAECQNFGDFLDVNAASFENSSILVIAAGRPDIAQVEARTRIGVNVGVEAQIDDVVGGNTRWFALDFQTPSGFMAHVDLQWWYNGLATCRLTGTALGG